MQRKQYPLRIDPEVWTAIQRWADDDFRSVNAQVEWILRDALRRAGRKVGGSADAEGAQGVQGESAQDEQPEA